MILLFSQQIKEKTAYHGQVLNGRKGKLRKKFGAGFPTPFSFPIFLFSPLPLASSQNLKVE